MNIFWKKFLFSLILAISVGFAVQNSVVGIAIFTIMLLAFWAPIYIKYAQDNPKHVWFKRKLFGWGWTPVTWQGWLAIGVYVALITLFASTLNEKASAREISLTFLAPSLFVTILLIRICYRTGEKPKWQWGKDIDKYQ